jgi:hypothetical protein
LADIVNLMLRDRSGEPNNGASNIRSAGRLIMIFGARRGAVEKR